LLALYHFGPVANSLTPLLCLLEKGLAFDDRFLNSRKWEHHAPEFQAINPQAMVPVLLHDSHVVTESTVINEYLDDAFPDAPLRPVDPWLRAEMRVWTKYVDEVFCPALTVIGAQGARPYVASIDKDEMCTILARMPNAEVRRKWEIISGTGYGEAQLDEGRATLGHVAERIEAALAHGGEWILGADYSLADIKLFSMAPGLERVLPDVCNATATPHLHGWLRRMEARPAVAAMRSREYQR
jgi:glutathione S-transferase